MTDKEAMQMALETLEEVQMTIATLNWLNKRVEILRTALAQPEPAECDGGLCGIGGYCKQCPKTHPDQAPVGWAYKHDIDMQGHNFWVNRENPAKDCVPLYRSPLREWQGLTDEKYEEMAENYVTNYFFDTLNYARAIEEKLKDKNS